MNEVFQIVPAPARAFWFIGAIGALLAVILGLMVYTAYSTRFTRFELSREGLRIRGDMWGRLVPAREIDYAGARRVDLGADPGLAPRRRTMGTGLPGYASGWFRLRNGEKALCFLTSRSRVVYIPTRAGFSVLLSVERDDAFLASLSRLAASEG